MRTLFTSLVALLVCRCMQAQMLPDYVPAEGLVAWYSFNGNSDDLSGNDNYGTLNGPEFTEDRFGHTNAAILLDTVNSDVMLVENSASINNTPALTISFWTRVGSLVRYGYSGYNQFFNKWSPSGPEYQYILGQNGAGFYFYYNTLDYVQFYSFPVVDAWTHVVLTYQYTGLAEDSKIVLYINGVPVETYDTYAPLNVLDFPLEIGGFGGFWFNTVDGEMDDIGIWNRVISESEIEVLYEAIETNTSELDHQTTFTLFPNPAHDIIYVSDENRNTTTYMIYNTEGRAVLSFTDKQSGNEIDVSALPTGVYQLVMYDGNSCRGYSFIKE